MTGDGPHILVVDDDRRLRDLLRRFLSDNGFFVSTAGDAGEARRLLDGMAVDLIILDVMMPGEDGLSFTASLRTRSHVPILLLTARGEVADRIDGLERGADDYLTKPFEPRELLARVASIMRRAAAAPPRAATTLRFGPCAFDLDRNELTRDGEPVRLTSQEIGLLRALAENAGEPLSREELIRQSGVEANERAVDVQVTRLRRKIEADPRAPRYLQTVRGAGYVLRPE